jgi:hypothetical protein
MPISGAGRLPLARVEIVMLATWDWGSFTGAVLGAVLAAAVALAVTYLARRGDRQREELEQARSVAAWLCSGWDLEEKVDASIVLVFRNGSEFPVHDFRITVTDPGCRLIGATANPLFDCFDSVRPPGREIVRADLLPLIDLAAKHQPSEVLKCLRVEVRFSDFAGRHWYRSAGVLERRPAPAEPPEGQNGS